MRYLVLACAFFLFSATLGHAQNQGLQNSSKVFTPNAKMGVGDIISREEMHRTWMAAIVRIPTQKGSSKQVRMSTLQTMKKPAKAYPTVIYMHGCSGVWKGTFRRIKFLANNGFLVIAPASLARKKYAKSCDSQTHKGGLYRGAVEIRKEDAGYAIENAKKLPMVDGDRIALMGLSEGGQAIANFVAGNDKQRVRARVIEGWTCHSGWNEQKGLKAPKDQPVLSLVAVNDPWFQTRWLKGDCGQFMSKNNLQQSVVYRTGSLAREHELLDYPAPQKKVLEFLRQHLVR